MSLDYRVGDVRDRLAEIPDGSIDLIVTSPPFLALRSYLPADHPDKSKEIGSEPTPAEFIDTLLALTAEWGRVLAPHGSICVELGDTFAGGGQGPDPGKNPGKADTATVGKSRGPGWPLAKSLTGIPTIYPWSLAYGRNLLTGQPHDAGQWRIRNVIVWARPNPPVGALGDKFRPATSYITVACKGAKRYFDLDAVRTEYKLPDQVRAPLANFNNDDSLPGNRKRTLGEFDASQSAGAPPLDWHADNHPEDGDWLWKLSTQPYKGSHYATYPLTLPTRLIEAMCPLKVCQTCGKPSERVVGEAEYVNHHGGPVNRMFDGKRNAENANGWTAPAKGDTSMVRQAPTLGFTDCGHDNYRTGVVLDPFAGSGTTLQAAQNVGRHAIGIDLDDRNADLARQRVGMFLTITNSKDAA